MEGGGKKIWEWVTPTVTKKKKIKFQLWLAGSGAWIGSTNLSPDQTPGSFRWQWGWPWLWRKRRKQKWCRVSARLPLPAWSNAPLSKKGSCCGRRRQSRKNAKGIPEELRRGEQIQTTRCFLFSRDFVKLKSLGDAQPWRALILTRG